MSIGPGKYDSMLTEALEKCDARQGILIVIDGNDGPSFCSQMDRKFMKFTPALLRDVADLIESDIVSVAEVEMGVMTNDT